MRDWLTKDFGWKLASLVVAAVIWHIVHSTIQEEPIAQIIENPLNQESFMTLTNLPILVVSTAEDVRAFKVNPNSVTVTVTGDKKNLAQLKSNEIQPMVNLTGIATTQNSGKRVDVSMPPGITLVNVEPPAVNVVAPAKAP
jgi:YbbR domain-containing protein